MSFPLLSSRHAPRVAGIIGLLSLLVALAGCSAVKLGYSSLPEVAYWWLDGYIDLEDDQARRVREDLQRVHAWHRGTELPRLAGLLQQVERLAPQDTTPEQVCAFEAGIRERFTALRERAEPAIVTHALSLTPAQLQQLERRYAQNNRDYEKDWLRLAPAEQVDKRLKTVAERFERVYGSLSGGQREALRRQLEQSSFDARRILAERQRRQQDTLTVLRQLTGQQLPLGEARARVRGLLERYTTSPDPGYRAYQATLVRETCGLIAAVHNGTSPSQREQAVRRLRGWQQDLAELSSAP
jgi:hypothetical protein